MSETAYGLIKAHGPKSEPLYIRPHCRPRNLKPYSALTSPDTLMKRKKTTPEARRRDLPVAAPAGLCFAGMAPEKSVACGFGSES